MNILSKFRLYIFADGGISIDIIRKKSSIFIVIILYIFMSTVMIDYYPPLGLDEALFSNPAYNLAKHGFFGTTLYDGYYNIENNTYWMTPLFMLILAVSYKYIGYNWINARLLSITMGGIALVGIFYLGKILFGKKSMIPMLSSLLLSVDMIFILSARWGRMETTVVAFGIWALVFSLRVITASSKINTIYVIGAGLFSTLSFMAHPNGFVFIVLAVMWLLITIFKSHLSLSNLIYTAVLFIGTLIICLLPYLLYLGSDFNNAMLQLKTNGANINNLFLNTLHEPLRYQRYIFPAKTSQIPFNLYTVLIFITGQCILFWRIFGKKKIDNSLYIFITCFMILSFLALLPNKTYQYLSIVTPFFILTTSYISEVAFRENFKFLFSARRPQLSHLFIGCSIALLFLNNLGANLIGWWSYRNVSISNTMTEVQRWIKPGDVVIGDGRFWLGIPNIKYIHAWAPSLYKTSVSLSIDEIPATHIITSTYIKNYLKTSNWVDIVEKKTTILTVFPDSLGGYVEIRKVFVK